MPQPFTALALCAISVTFWNAGTGPGILATLLSALIRAFFFDCEVDLISSLTYELVFLIFAALMTQVPRARHELEVGSPSEPPHSLTPTRSTLSISRSIVESLGGRLWAADDSPRGASFHLTLPAAVQTDE